MISSRLIGRELLFSVVSLSVAVILFEGGLSLRIRELRETGQAVFGLVTLGVLVTWLLTAVAAWLLLGFEPTMANLRVLLISVLFIVLASRLQLKELTCLGVWGVSFLAALLVVVRPAASAETVEKIPGL